MIKKGEAVNSLTNRPAIRLAGINYMLHEKALPGEDETGPDNNDIGLEETSSIVEETTEQEEGGDDDSDDED